jgi:hypothetical protein
LSRTEITSSCNSRWTTWVFISPDYNGFRTNAQPTIQWTILPGGVTGQRKRHRAQSYQKEERQAEKIA